MQISIAAGLCRFRRKVLDGSGNAPLQIGDGFAILPGVDCVFQDIQRALKDFYNVQWNFIGHVYHLLFKFSKNSIYRNLDAGGFERVCSAVFMRGCTAGLNVANRQIRESRFSVEAKSWTQRNAVAQYSVMPPGAD